MNSTNSMNKYYTFLKTNNIKTFDELKTLVESDIYKLKVKEDKTKESLAIIFNNYESNLNEEMVLFFNGVIIDKNTLKIVCYTFDKCLEDENLDMKLLEGELYVEPAFEGTLIRVYYAENKWNLSTKKMIDAYNAKWISSKSFGELFSELFDVNLLPQLNINYCYSFLMSHNDNNIVLKYDHNFLIHINTIDLVQNCEVSVDIGIQKNTLLKIENTNKEYLDSYIEELKNNSYNTEAGFILINNQYRRQKINKKMYLKYRDLWGNTNNRLFRYLHLRKNNDLLMEYLNYYSCDKETFLKYEHYLMSISTFILDIYRNRHVSKKIDKVPYYIRDIIYKIHGLYLQTRNKVVFKDVNVLLYELDEKKFCFIINNIEKDMKKQKELQEKKEKEEEKQDTMDVENTEISC